MPTIATGSGVEDDPTLPSRMLLVMLGKAWAFVKTPKNAVSSDRGIRVMQ